MMECISKTRTLGQAMDDEDEIIDVVQIGKIETRVRTFDTNDSLLNEVVTTVVHFEPQRLDSGGIGMYL
jgi:hypothetical protein